MKMSDVSAALVDPDSHFQESGSGLLSDNIVRRLAGTFNVGNYHITIPGTRIEV